MTTGRLNYSVASRSRPAGLGTKAMNEFAFTAAITNILKGVLHVEPAGDAAVAAVRHRGSATEAPMPVLLEAFYGLVEGSDEVMSAHHRFLPKAEVWSHEGRLVFCEENERVVYWGIEPSSSDAEDPPVSQLNSTSGSWCRDCPRLSLFLLNMLCWQLLTAAPAMGRCPHSDDLLAAVRKLFQPACDGLDRYDLMGFYSEGVLACFLRPKLFFLGCRDEATLAEWRRRLDVELECL
jgi:hypothetical protein